MEEFEANGVVVTIYDDDTDYPAWYEINANGTVRPSERESAASLREIAEMIRKAADYMDKKPVRLDR